MNLKDKLKVGSLVELKNLDTAVSICKIRKHWFKPYEFNAIWKDKDGDVRLMQNFSIENIKRIIK